MMIEKIKNHILRLTVTDSIQKESLIYCAYDPVVFLRRHNLPHKTNYFLPKDILTAKIGKSFNFDDTEFLKACDTFNLAVQFNKPGMKISKLVMGERIGVFIQDIITPDNVLSFELDEKKFTGLMIKYRKPDEIRKMIKEIFTQR